MRRISCFVFILFFLGYDAVVGLLEKVIHMMHDVVKTDKFRQEILEHLSNIVTFFEKLSMADR